MQAQHHIVHDITEIRSYAAPHTIRSDDEVTHIWGHIERILHSVLGISLYRIRTLKGKLGAMRTVIVHSSEHLSANGAFPAQRYSIQRSPPRLLKQPGRRHAQCRTRAVVKTPSTEEPLRAPGSESNFTGSPANKQDIPITSPTSSSKHMQVNRVLLMIGAVIAL